MAGHDRRGASLKIDTHGAPVCDRSWELLAHAYACHGERPTLLERDFNLRHWARLYAETDRIRELLRRGGEAQLRSLGYSTHDAHDLATAFRRTYPAIRSGALPRRHRDRRMAIYGYCSSTAWTVFISSGFPVLRQLFDEPRWHRLVRAFMREHRARTPYFNDWARSSSAGCGTAAGGGRSALPAGLAHYEWVELACRWPRRLSRRCRGLVSGRHWPGRWPIAEPVHRLGPSHRPMEPPASRPACWSGAIQRSRCASCTCRHSPIASQRLSEEGEAPVALLPLLRELAGSCGLSADVEYFENAFALLEDLAPRASLMGRGRSGSDDEDCLPAFTACPRRHPSSGFLAPLALRLYLAPVFWMAGCQKLADMPATISGSAIPTGTRPAVSRTAGLARRAEARPVARAAVVRPGRALDQPALMVTMLVAIFAVHWPNGWQAIADPSAPFANAQVLEAGEKLARAGNPARIRQLTTG